MKRKNLKTILDLSMFHHLLKVDYPIIISGAQTDLKTSMTVFYKIMKSVNMKVY